MGNVLYDESSGSVTLIDLGGMGSSSFENDVSYFSRSLSLSARLVGQQLESQGLRHFEQGYAKASGVHAKSSSCVPESRAKLSQVIPTLDLSKAKKIPEKVLILSCRSASAHTAVSQRMTSTYPTLLM